MLVYHAGDAAVAAIWRYSFISATQIYVEGSGTLYPKGNSRISIEAIKRKNKW
jgi:hypothetical protein